MSARLWRRAGLVAGLLGLAALLLVTTGALLADGLQTASNVAQLTAFVLAVAMALPLLIAWYRRSPSASGAEMLARHVRAQWGAEAERRTMQLEMPVRWRINERPEIAAVLSWAGLAVLALIGVAWLVLERRTVNRWERSTVLWRMPTAQP